MSTVITYEKLTVEAFAPYGEVISKQQNKLLDMNGGMADNYRAVGHANTKADNGETVISIVVSKQYPIPFTMGVVERHPLGSQAFIPQSNTPFIVIVAEAGEWQGSESLKAFITDGSQGINYHIGTWHCPLLTPYGETDFICIDRQGEGNNCEVIQLTDEQSRLIEA